jgi:hypothetical protein
MSNVSRALAQSNKESKMNLPKLNDTLINRVIEHITKFPESYDQNDVAISCEITKKTPCGSIGCFGGWAVLLGVPKEHRQKMAPKIHLGAAADVLGLTDDESDFLFEGATGNPKADLKVVKERVARIRETRELVEKLKNVERLDIWVETEYDGVVALSYED